MQTGVVAVYFSVMSIWRWLIMSVPILSQIIQSHTKYCPILHEGKQNVVRAVRKPVARLRFHSEYFAIFIDVKNF